MQSLESAPTAELETSFKIHFLVVDTIRKSLTFPNTK